MGIVQRQGIYSTLVIYAGIALGYGNIWLFLKFFEKSEWGIRTLLIDVNGVIAMFALLGLPSGVLKFYPDFELDGSKKDEGLLLFFLPVFVIFFFLTWGIYFFFSEVLLSLYAEKSQDFLVHSDLIMPLVGGFGLCQLLFAVLNAKRDTSFVAFVRELFIRLITTIAICLYVTGKIDFSIFLKFVVASYYVAALLMLARGLIAGTINFKIPHRKIKWTYFKQIFEFCGFIFLGGSAGVIVAKSDTLMLGSLISTESVAVYSFAFFMSAVIDVPKRAIGQISTTLLSKFVKQKQWKEVNDLYKKTSLHQQLGSVIGYLMIALCLTEIFKIIPKGEEYKAAGDVLLFLGLARIVNSTYSLNADIIGYSRYFRWNLGFVLFFSGVAIVSNYYMIGLWGMNGAAAASFGTIFLGGTLRYLFVRSKMKLSPFTLQSVYLTAFSVLVYLVGNEIGMLINPYFSIVFKCFGIAVFFAAYLYILKPSVEIDRLFKKILKK